MLASHDERRLSGARRRGRTRRPLLTRTAERIARPECTGGTTPRPDGDGAAVGSPPGGPAWSRPQGGRAPRPSGRAPPESRVDHASAGPPPFPGTATCTTNGGVTGDSSGRSPSGVAADLRRD